MTEEIELDLIFDEAVREKKPTVGYVAMFEYLNGFRKTIYWSKDKMLAHADRYSPAFHLNAVNNANPKKSRVSYADFVAGNYPKDDAWKYSSFWYKNFDGMAFKTMLRQLISKWGIMSIELQTAFEKDAEPEIEDVYIEDGTPALTAPDLADDQPEPEQTHPADGKQTSLDDL